MKEPTLVDGIPDEATAAKVLAHPLRRRLLDEIDARGPQSSKSLAEIVGTNVQGVNHHIRALERAGFLELDAVESRRNVEAHFYRAVLQARLEVWPIPRVTSARAGSP